MNEAERDAAVEAFLDALLDCDATDRADMFAALREAYCLSCGYEQPERGSCQCQNDD